MLSKRDVNQFITKNRLEKSIICLHSSMKSFGETESGPQTIIDPLLDSNTTVIVPAFYYKAESNPLRSNYPQNGIDYTIRRFDNPVNYTGSSDMIEASMGVIPKTILTYPAAIRSKNPMGSFAGIGPQAKEIISTQALLNVYGPYKKIYQDFDNAYILMAGTTLVSCTPVHFAEEKAGRKLFRRWALMDNSICEFEAGGCSNGFDNILPHTLAIQKTGILGSSKVLIYPFKPFIDLVTDIIRKNPDITRCLTPGCLCCEDIIKGGPILQ